MSKKGVFRRVKKEGNWGGEGAGLFRVKVNSERVSFESLREFPACYMLFLIVTHNGDGHVLRM